MTCSVSRFIDEPASGVDDVGVTAKCLDEGFHLIEAIEQFRVFLRDAEQLASLRLLLSLDLVNRPVFECLVTPHAELLIARRLLPTPVTRDCRDWIGFVIGDVETVCACNLSIARLGEYGDVACRSATPGRPSVVILEVGLVDVPARQVRRRGFAEVCEGNWLRNAGTLSRLARDLPRHLVGDFSAGPERAPEGSRVIIASRMVLQPSIQVRDGRNEEDRPLPRLPVDGDLEAVLVIGDVADSEAKQLARSGPSVPRDGDESGVAGVHRRINQGADIILPVKHVRRVGTRIVVTARRCWNPFQTVWDVIAVGEEATESTQCISVVLVALRVLVLPVDNADNGLSGLAVFEDTSEITCSFSEDRTVAEQLFMAVDANPRRDEFQSIAEFDQELSIGFRNVSLALFELFSETVKCTALVGHGGTSAKLKRWELNLGFKSLSWRFSANNTVSTA